MAESEPVKQFEDDDWFDDVTCEPAGETKQESAEVGENLHSEGQLHRGFVGADIFVTEGKVSKKCNFGTCVLLQDPATWGKKDSSPRRFVITAGHCVSRNEFGKSKKYSKFRIRIPIRPWKDFPQDSKKYKGGPENTKHLYKSIVIKKEQIFIHKKFDGLWNCGYDVALIAIPETAPSAFGFSFNICEHDNFPSSAFVNGYPLVKDKAGTVHSHIPYYSGKQRQESEEEEDEWMLTYRTKGRMMGYPLATKPGISGGALIVEDVVVGIHNASNDKKAGHGFGTVFTPELKNWIEDIYPKWGSIMSDAAEAPLQRSDTFFTSVSENISPPLSQEKQLSPRTAPKVSEKPVSSWNAPEVAAWLISIKLEKYADEFLSEGVSGELLVDLDEDMLGELGIKKKLHRHKFKKGQQILLMPHIFYKSFPSD